MPVRPLDVIPPSVPSPCHHTDPCHQTGRCDQTDPCHRTGRCDPTDPAEAAPPIGVSAYPDQGDGTLVGRR